MTNPSDTPPISSRTPPPVATPTSGQENPDGKACMNCGYALDGLATEGVCPECGTAIHLSLRSDRLVFANLEWLTRVRRGLVLIEIAIALLIAQRILGGIAATFGAMSMSAGTLFWLGSIVTLFNTGLELWGWWLVSTPEPARAETLGTLTPTAWLRPLGCCRAACEIGYVLLLHIPAFGMSSARTLANALSECVFVALVMVAGGLLENLAIRAQLLRLLKTVRIARANTWIIVVRAAASLAAAIVGMASTSSISPMIQMGFGCMLIPLSIAWIPWAIWYVMALDGTRNVMTRIIAHRKHGTIKPDHHPLPPTSPRESGVTND